MWCDVWLNSWNSLWMAQGSSSRQQAAGRGGAMKYFFKRAREAIKGVPPAPPNSRVWSDHQEVSSRAEGTITLHDHYQYHYHPPIQSPECSRIVDRRRNLRWSSEIDISTHILYSERRLRMVMTMYDPRVARRCDAMPVSTRLWYHSLICIALHCIPSMELNGMEFWFWFWLWVVQYPNVHCIPLVVSWPLGYPRTYMSSLLPHPMGTRMFRESNLEARQFKLEWRLGWRDWDFGPPSRRLI